MGHLPGGPCCRGRSGVIVPAYLAENESERANVHFPREEAILVAARMFGITPVHVKVNEVLPSYQQIKMFWLALRSSMLGGGCPKRWLGDQRCWILRAVPMETNVTA